MLQDLLEEDGGDGAGPSEPRAPRVVKPISFPTAFDSTEDYEAAWEHGELEAIDPEDLFPPLLSAVYPMEAVSTQIFHALTTCYQSEKNQRIPKPATAETLSIEAAYLRLALIYEKKSAARSDAHDHRIIFGEAGVGKSIFSQYLAYHWSREENPLWGGPQGRFQAVFWIRLKELLGEARSQPFESLLCKYCMPTLADQVAVELRTWLASHADRALFILDGYDEVADAVFGQNLVLRDFIETILRQPFVLITSRPYRYSQIGGQPIESFAHYRNIGFRSEDFPRYLEAYFAEHPQKVRLIRNIVAWLDQHLIAKSIARVPLQLGVIAWLWQDAAEHQGRPLPDMLTLSTLYQEIAQRRLQIVASSESKLVGQCLSELAYGGMNAINKAERYQFTTQRICDVLTRLSHEYPISFPALEQCFFQEVLRLGLLRSEKGSVNLQQADHYYFCHLTYQEYYCARYILGLFARIEQDKSYEHQIVELIAHKKFEQRYTRVWWFVAGLLGDTWKKANETATSVQAPADKLTVTEALTRHQLAIFFNEFQRGLRDIIGGYELGLLVRCVEEAQIEPRRFASDFPELYLRLQAGVKVLGRAVEILSGISREELQTNPFLNQLYLSPHVRVAIMNQDLMQNLPENRHEIWQKLVRYSIDAIVQRPSARQHNIKKLVPLVVQLSIVQLKEVVDQLLNALADQNDAVRKKAATTLGQLSVVIPEPQCETVISGLLSALSNSNEGLQQSAVTALGQLSAVIPESQCETVISGLLSALANSNERLQQSAVTALGQLSAVIPESQCETVISGLLTALSNSNEGLQQSTVTALGQLSAVIPESQCETVIRELLNTLTNSSNKWVQIKAATTLGQLSAVIVASQRETVIDGLLNALENSSDEWLQKSAVTALGQLSAVIPESQCETVIRELLNALENSSDEWFQGEAVTALAQLVAIIPESQQEAVVKKLLIVLESSENSNEWLQKSAATTLNQLAAVIAESQCEMVIGGLLSALANSNERLQQSAVTALGQLSAVIPESQCETVICELLNALENSSNEWFQDKAVTALAQLAAIIPASQQETVVEKLLVVLESSANSNEWLQKSAVTTLNQLAAVIPESQRQTLVTKLLRLLDANEWLQKSAMTTLGQLLALIPESQREAVVKKLLTVLAYSSDQWLQIKAATTLGQLCDVIPESQCETVLGGLLSALADPKDLVRKRAATTLGQLSALIPESQQEAVVKKLLTVLAYSSDQWLQIKAATTLGQLCDVIPESQCETVLSGLLSALADPKDLVREQAATTLGQLSALIPKSQQGAVVKKLLTVLADSSNQWLQIKAATTLGQLCDVIPESQCETVLSGLLSALADSSNQWLQESAMTALGQLLAAIPESRREAIANQLLGANEKLQENKVEISFRALFAVSSSPVPFTMALIPALRSVITAELPTIPKPFLLFHTDPEVRMGALLILTLSSVHSLDWRSQRLLALSSGYPDSTEDHSATTFNQASLKDITKFLRLILLFCTEPKLRERLCLLMAYLCFSHRLAITVEEIQGSSCLKVYRQESSEIIPLAPQEIDSTLDNLRQVYVEEVDPLHHSEVFPEVPTLIRYQRLWGLFRMPPPAEPTINEKFFKSLMTHPNQALEVTRDQWVVGVGACKFEGWFNSHAFLVIEGMDEYGRGLFLRYDLARDHNNPVEKYHVVSQKILSLQDETERSQALLKDILKGKKKCFVCCCLRRKTETATLVRLTEADVAKDMTAHYRSLGNRFMSLQTSVQSGQAKQQKINCLTWILQHLKIALGDEKFQRAFGELEQGLPIPIDRVKVINESRCTLM